MAEDGQVCSFAKFYQLGFASMSTKSIFTHLFCRHDQALTPYQAGRVLRQEEETVELELHCRRCGTRVLYETDQLPEGYRVYQVWVTAEDNPSLPAEFRPQPLPYMEEEFAVVATSAQGAYEAADFATSLPFRGHLVHWYVDGKIHLDERF